MERTRGLSSSSELLASLYVLPLVRLLRALRLPLLVPLAGGASMSISSTGPMRMETPGSTWPLDGICLSMVLSMLLGMVSADFTRGRKLAMVRLRGAGDKAQSAKARWARSAKSDTTKAAMATGKSRTRCEEIRGARETKGRLRRETYLHCGHAQGAHRLQTTTWWAVERASGDGGDGIQNDQVLYLRACQTQLEL